MICSAAAHGHAVVADEIERQLLDRGWLAAPPQSFLRVFAPSR
jgi:hypothetical protein